MKVAIAVEIGTRGRSPRQVREDFAEALRAAILAEYEAGRIDLGISEELLRILPKPGRA